MKVVTTTGVTQDQGENGVKGKVEKSAGRRFGYNYIVIKSYKESQKNDVVKCLYIKSLTKFGFCVIKEGTNGDTKDKQGRDIIDRLKWQKQLHELLQDKIRMPRILGTFKENGNYYLVIEHIKGKPFSRACSEKRKELRYSIINGGNIGIKFLDYLIQISGILETMHQEKIVHRDATANNFIIMPNGKVAVIDMEMCYSIQQRFPLPAFQLGTYGYMSPQQEATETPTTAEDIYALGAMILLVWTGIAPSKLTNDPIELLIQRMPLFIPDQQIADIVIQALHPEAEKRPAAKFIKQALLQYQSDLQRKVKRPIHSPVYFTQQEIMTSLQGAIDTLASPLLADESRGWFADNMKPPPDAEKHKLSKMWYASFNRGDSGIIYMLSQAKKVGLNVTGSLPFVAKGLERIRERYIDRIEKAFAGLHFGSDGIAASLAVAIQQNLIEPAHEHLEWIELLLEKQNNGGGIISGVAGQGLANLAATPFISPQKIQSRLQRYAQYLIEKQEKDGRWIHGYYRQKITKRKRIITNPGFGEGMAGTIYFLLEYGQRYNHFESIEAAQKGLQWLIKKVIFKKGTFHWLSSKQKNLNWWWWEGTAGIVLTYIKAYQITQDPIYKKVVAGALYSIPDTVLDGNLGQGNGLSGLGEVYLQAWYVFKEEVWLRRAGWIAQVIMHLKKHHRKHGSYWLVEHERQPVANFMIGNTGVMHFLLRYCYPDKISFPFMSDLL